MKPRRIASVQLLGSVQEGVFNPGITILPTLDTPAEIGAPNVLKAVFESPPRRNKPEDYEGDDFDCDLRDRFTDGAADCRSSGVLQRSILAAAGDRRQHRLWEVVHGVELGTEGDGRAEGHQGGAPRLRARHQRGIWQGLSSGGRRQ